MNLDLSDGINVIEGKNESGKSTIAAFIKFMLYGLSAKSESNQIPERQRFPSWETREASGSMLLSYGGKSYRIERQYFYGQKGSNSEFFKVSDAISGEEIPGTPESLFCHVPEDLYKRSCFIGQLEGSRINGGDLHEAIENLLYSGDESINIQRAMKKLDDARILLLHKNQKGGKIFNVRCEQEQEMRLLHEAKQLNEHFIEMQKRAEDNKKILIGNRAKLAECEYQIKYTDAARRLRQIRTSQQAEDDYQRKNEQLASYKKAHIKNDFLPDGDYLIMLKEHNDEMRSMATELEELDFDIKVVDSKLADAAVYSAEENVPLDQIARNKTKTAVFLASGFILALMSAAVFSLIYLDVLNLEERLYMPFLSAAGIGMTFAASSIISAFLYRRRTKNIFRSYRVKTVSELSKIVEEINHNRMIFMSLEESRDKLIAFQKEITEAKSAKFIEIQALLAEYDIFPVDIGGAYAAESEIEAIISSMDRLAAEVEQSESYKQAVAIPYTEQEEATCVAILSSGSPNDKIEGDDYVELIKRHNFYKQTTEALTHKHHESEKKLSEMSVRVVSPNVIIERIKALQEEERRLLRTHDAYALAHEKLGEASHSLRSKIAPRLSSAASNFMRSATMEKYENLNVDGKMSLHFTESADGGKREVGFLSAGTQDLAYISLRLALIDLLFKKEKPPLIFDESFVRQDETRLAATLKAVGEYAHENQVIILTSQNREARVLDGVGEYNHVQLG